MKFYDLEWLADKCGTDNKYEITAKVSAEARRQSEEAQIEKFERVGRNYGKNPLTENKDERFISNVLAEIEEGKSPINSKKTQLDEILNSAEPVTQPQ